MYTSLNEQYRCDNHLIKLVAFKILTQRSEIYRIPIVEVFDKGCFRAPTTKLITTSDDIYFRSEKSTDSIDPISVVRFALLNAFGRNFSRSAHRSSPFISQPWPRTGEHRCIGKSTLQLRGLHTHPLPLSMIVIRKEKKKRQAQTFCSTTANGVVFEFLCLLNNTQRTSSTRTRPST